MNDKVDFRRQTESQKRESIEADRKILFVTPEGKMFALGFLLVIAWAITLFVLSFFYDKTGDIFTMIVTHLVSGRLGGISVGIEQGLPRWLVIMTATFVDSLVVMMVYPIFVFSYKNYIKARFFKEMIDTGLGAAKKNEGRMKKYGPIGLLFFVWFPLHMTGPFIGSIIGFFLGLHPFFNLFVVITGTFLAVVSWVYFVNKLSLSLGKYSFVIPIVVISLALCLFMYVKLKNMRQNRKNGDKTDAAE